MAVEGQKNEEEVVEKRVARRVIRRRAKATDEDQTTETKEAPKSLKLEDSGEKTQSKSQTSAEKTEEANPELTVVKKPRVVGKLTLKDKEEELAQSKAAAKSEEPQEKPVAQEENKNLSFKDRLKGTISLDKIKQPERKAKPAGEQEESQTKPGFKGRVAQTTTQAKEKEKAAKQRKVKNIGGDLDIEGGGKSTTLTHLVRTSARDRVFRPDARSGRGKKKIISKKNLKSTKITTKKASKRVIEYAEGLTVGSLAQQLGIKAGEIIKKLMELGVMATINQALDHDTVTLIATEYEHTVKDISFKEEEILGAPVEEVTEETDENLKQRPPIVTVMGHVDHGKTSLLDAIRSTTVTEGESGGITQHIGAYTVSLPQGEITFLDTPGHEAFTTMRARGANVTDIVILVVAADDGIMPQTEESISHAQAAGVPIIIAINKMDKPEANPDVVLRQLSEKGLLSEEWGGDVLTNKVSAINKDGIKELLENVLLQSEMLELKANHDKNAKGVVIEAKLEKGRGAVCTLLVQEGQVSVGDPVVAGEFAGKIRAMQNWKGDRVKAAGPSQAVEILGLEGVPQASDPFHVVESEQDAKKVASHRQEQTRQQQSKSGAVSLEDMFSQMTSADVKEFNFILKTDAQGSLEAIEQAINKLGNEEVKPKIIHTGVGAIKESDIQLAMASSAVILGFHVRPETKAIHLAKDKEVEVKLYKIIYDLVDEVKLALSGLLAPTIKENYLGRAEIRETFQVSKIGIIAGSMVVDGLIKRGAKLRLLRDNVVIHEGEIGSLKRFKDDAKEVKQGFECGVGIEGYQDIQTGDVIEAYELQEVERTL